MPTLAPDAASALNALHVASGTGVLPVRTLIASAVPAGMLLDHAADPHAACDPALNVRDVNVPELAYGLSRIQSTVNTLPSAVSSLTSGRSGVVTVIVCVATTTPSIAYVTMVGSQSIQNRWGAFVQMPGIGVATELMPSLVTAWSAPLTSPKA